MAARPERQIGVELTGYREHDDGPRQLRVDIVDRDDLTTLASLLPADALSLSSDLLAAVVRARNGG